LIAGGTGVGSTLTYKTTTGVGATDAHIFQVGNNGATEAMRILTSGNVGVGRTTASYKLDVQGTGGNLIRVTNTTTSSTATIDFINNAGNGVTIGVTGSTYATYGALAANENYMYSGGAYTFMADGSGYFKWASGGSAESMRLQNGNLGLGTTTFGTSAVKVLAIKNGTAPSTSPTDTPQIYSADITAGNAAIHTRTENGAIIKLYQETTGVAAATFVANTSLIADDSATWGGYTIGQVVATLKLQGLLS